MKHTITAPTGHAPIFDILLAEQKQALLDRGFPQSLVMGIDHASAFVSVAPHALAPHHRWTRSDIGRSYVGFENPNGRGAGLAFATEILDVDGPARVRMELTEVYDVRFDVEAGFSNKSIDALPYDLRFEIDASQPMTWEGVAQICALLDFEETYTWFRLFMAAQTWSLKKT